MSTRGGLVSARHLPAGYYALLVVVLLLDVTGTVHSVLPHLLSKHLAEDSEGLLLALVLPAWIQYARPRLLHRREQWPATGAAAAVCLAVGLWLYGGGSGVSGKVVTLNESFLALAVLLPYVQLRRPRSPALALGLSGGVLLVVLVASRAALVTDLAECLAMLVLVPIGLDVVDRGILDPSARTAEASRWCWYAFLLLAPACISVLTQAVGGEVLRYAVRVQEAFVGLLLLELYLAVGLHRTGRRATTGPRADARH